MMHIIIRRIVYHEHSLLSSMYKKILMFNAFSLFIITDNRFLFGEEEDDFRERMSCIAFSSSTGVSVIIIEQNCAPVITITIIARQIASSAIGETSKTPVILHSRSQPPVI